MLVKSWEMKQIWLNSLIAIVGLHFEEIKRNMKKDYVWIFMFYEIFASLSPEENYDENELCLFNV